MNPYDQLMTPILEITSSNKVEDALEMWNSWRPLNIRPLIVATMANARELMRDERMRAIYPFLGIDISFNWNDATGWKMFCDDYDSLLDEMDYYDDPIFFDCRTCLRKSGATGNEGSRDLDVIELGLARMCAFSNTKSIWYGFSSMHPLPITNHMKQVISLRLIMESIMKYSKPIFVDDASGYANWMNTAKAYDEYGGIYMWFDARLRFHDIAKKAVIRMIHVCPQAITDKQWNRRKPFGIHNAIGEIVTCPGCIVNPSWDEFETVGKSFAEKLGVN